MKVLKLFRGKFEETVKEVIPILKAGGVIAVPTDTVYGLGADALNGEASRRVFKIKRRREKNPLPIFVGSFKKAGELARIEDEKVKDFLEKVWPGKITCVLKAREEVPEAIKAQDGTIALRIPSHDFVLKVLYAFGRPLTGTSANISGDPPLVKIQELIEEFETAEVKPDLIVDAGDLPESLPSTLVDLTSRPFKILREGAVSEEELKVLTSSFGDY